MSQETQNGRGARIAAEVFAVLGAVVLTLGAAVAIAGAQNYERCQVIGPGPCSTTLRSGGLVALGVGVVLVVIGVVVRRAERTTR